MKRTAKFWQREKVKSNKTVSHFQGKNPAHLLLSAILIVFTLTLYEQVIAWISLLVICSVVIRSAIFFAYQKHLPSMRTLNLLAILSTLGLVYSAWPLGFLLGMVNLLVLACALKLMQMRSQRDFYQLVVSTIFLLGCGFIFNQSISMTFVYAALTLLVIVALGFFHAPSLTLRQQTRQLGLLSLQALPIGLLLFLLLPQLPPLWQTPRAKTAESGLAEKITPGDIARLSQSSELAFRATFVDGSPNHASRYWRTIVMEDFDGRSWQVHPVRKQQRLLFQSMQQEFKPVLSGPYRDYDIIAEATQQIWLPALDLATPLGAKSQSEIWQSNDFQLISMQPLVSKYQYSVRSFIAAMPYQLLSQFDRELNLSVPKTGNPRTQAWIQNLRTRYAQDTEFTQALLDYFTRQDFSYTLRPRAMLVDPVDTFLFDAQAGFCSHFASAFAYSLRLAGIPARLVTGYQGGEISSKANQADYISVYQYDAHAWVEAWFADTGWRRFDPTALVAPDRINFGLRQAMQEEGSFLADSPFSLARLTNIAVFNQLRLLLADLDYNWSRWVLGFDSQKQQDLFKAIVGKLTPQRLALLGLGIVSIIALLLLLFFIPNWLAGRVSGPQRFYLDAVRALSKAGLARQPWQGPQDFNNAVAQQYPEVIHQPFAQLTELYMQSYYANTVTSENKAKQTANAGRQMKKQLSNLQRALRKLKH
jgi:protein-glutamine gamma-glutamyltransferase